MVEIILATGSTINATITDCDLKPAFLTTGRRQETDGTGALVSLG